ncbi:MAG: thioredoxin-disulfide reductase [Flammeovirgaceae bacterium TMED290]|nr:MAG: thioredoxin-disulfide reductase [Flammeovirgaceae bacterium TMED290]|tara:strand:+ start:6540 stop:7472 length:933 start_codon:yes stop_codon:yes gene_type:complete
MSKKSVDVLIIGSGPAGYTAAIYTSRAGLKTILYKGDQPGGQLTITSDVENYPGYPDGVLGPQMMVDFENQASRFGAEIKTGMINDVDFQDDNLKAVAEDGNIIKSKTVIISTGASAKWLNLDSEQRLNGKGVSACAVCDGFFFKNQVVGVVGGGDTAAEEALYLSKLTSKVHLIVRRGEMRASTIMQNRVLENEKIKIHWDSEVKEVLGHDAVTGIDIINNKSNEMSSIKLQGLFIAIGHKPNTDIFKDFLDMDENGYIKTIPGSTQTNIKGVFATGDAQDHVYRQAVTAAGSGCMGALDAERYISNNY